MSDPTHLSLLSPDRRVEIRFALGDWCADGRRLPDAPLWQVWFAGRLMLRWSLLGTFQSFVDKAPDEVPDMDAAGLEIVGVVRHRCRQTWQPAYGDAATLVDRHNELVVRLREREVPNRRLDLIFRCGDQGAAIRVRLPRQRRLARVTPTGNGSVFLFPDDTQRWMVAGEVHKAVVDAMAVACDAPLTLNYAHGKLACLLQTGAAPLRLQPTRDGLAALPAVGTPVAVATPYESPWQVLLLADAPCDLPNSSGFLLNLSWGEERGYAALPFLRYPLWVADSAGRDASGGDSADTTAHRLALELVGGAGAARWDETRFLRGEIGAFVVVARRMDAVWQVAGITGVDGRVLTVRLGDILGQETKGTYTLRIFRDPLPGETAVGGVVRETFRGVDACDKPRLELLPHGGFLLRLEPECSSHD